MRPWVVMQHEGYEGPGAIADAIATAGRDCTVVRVDRTDPVPLPDAVGGMAGLVVMGGPMSVHDDLDWLAQERDLIGAAVEAGLPVLGVCLGAQQLAAALGGDVYPGPEPELGVGEVHLTHNAAHDPVFGPAPTILPCLQWHGETFSLPEGAVLLASTEAYAHQAFRVGSCAYGLQFHIEVTAALVARWAPHLPPGIIVRTPDVAHVARHGAGILKRFVALVAE